MSPSGLAGNPSHLHTPRLALLLACAATAAACQPADEPALEPFPFADVLMTADRSFARASAERGGEAWAEVWAGRGVLHGGGARIQVGPDQVSRAVAETVDRLRWKPTAGAMVWPGALGYTVGRWWLEPDAGATEGASGRYLTVWQRVGQEWRVALDFSLPEQTADDFDFWLGDWTLAQSIRSGKGDAFEDYGGRSRVRGIPGGGALVESFEGEVRFFWAKMTEPARIRGFSVRFYDPAAATWHIYWMDTLTREFGAPFSGTFAGGTGEFLRSAAPDGRPRSRIRFRPQPDGTVDWELAIHAPAHDLWQPLWKIGFRPSTLPE